MHRNTVARWVREAREGKLAPAARGHNPRKLSGEDEERLAALVADNPDLPLREIRERHFPDVSLTTLYKTLSRLGLMPGRR